MEDCTDYSTMSMHVRLKPSIPYMVMVMHEVE